MQISKEKKPAKYLLMRARGRAKRKGLDYNLCEQDLLPLPTHCPILGFELKADGGYQDPHAYSLDRVDNSKGYIVGNVAVMSYQANRLKNNGTSLELRAIADWMDQKHQDRIEVTYPIKSELDHAHKLLCKASTSLVIQIVLKRYRPADTREAHKKATEAVEALQNLIDGTAPLG